MDIERSLEDKFRLNILCYSFPSTTEEFFDKIVTLLNKSVSTISFSTATQSQLKEKGKNAVPSQDWSTSWVNTRYFVKNLILDWPECQIYYRCHAAIVIIDMATCDIEKIEEELVKLKKNITTDHIPNYSMFIFNGNPEEHSKYFTEEKSAVFINSTEQEELIPLLLKEVETVVFSTATHFFYEMGRLRTDNHTVPLFNAKEEVPKDSSKVKKRKQGRSLKLTGDLALILSCLKDASGYFQQAYEILKSNEDYLWLGLVRESQAACTFLEFITVVKEGQVNVKIQAKAIELITEKMESASVNLRRARSVKSLDFDKECFFKLLKVLKELRAKNNFSDFVKFYVDTSRTGVLGEEHYRIMIKLASFFYDMKMYRKAGLFLKMIGDQILQDNFNPDLARDIYLVCFPLYNIPLSKEILPDNFPKNDFLKIIADNPDIGQEIKRVAPLLQLQLVNDVLALPSSDVALQTKIISIILHYFLEDINTFTQQKLFNHLISLGNTLNKNLKLDLTFLPQVMRISPVKEVLNVNIKQYEAGSDKGSSIFIYNPWKKGGGSPNDFNWMVGNFCSIKISLKNIFEFEIFVDMIMLVIEGVKTINYPTSVIMRKTKSLQELTLKFKPLEKGNINILGVITKLSNFVHFHPINMKGVVLKNFSEQKLPKDRIGIRNVPIKEKVSTLKAYFEDTQEEILLYENSLFYTRLIIENKNDSAVCLRKVMISFAFTDNTTLDRELSINDDEIPQHETLSVIICRAIAEQEQTVRDLFKMHPHLLFNVHSISNIDRLFKIYVKLIYYEKEKPNISIEENITKEVKMLKSLSVSRIQFIESMTPSEIIISRKSYKHVSIDEGPCLSLDITREDQENNKNDYKIAFYLKDRKQPIAERLMLGNWNSINLLLKIDRRTLMTQKDTDSFDISKMFYGIWKDANSLNSGYLFLNKTESSPLAAKVESAEIKISMETNLEVDDDKHTAKIGELYKVKAKIRTLEKEKQKLYVSVILSEDNDAEQAYLTKNEKSVLYKGKKAFLVELGEGKEEVEVEVGVMLMEKKEYKMFCFVVNESLSIVYSYKYSAYIIVE